VVGQQSADTADALN